MLYAQFSQRSAVDRTKIVEACSDRAVVIYDGRLRLLDVIADARMECARRGYVGFQLYKGESFTRSNPISPLYLL